MRRHRRDGLHAGRSDGGVVVAEAFGDGGEHFREVRKESGGAVGVGVGEMRSGSLSVWVLVLVLVLGVSY